MYLDYAENQAGRQISMKMADWTQKLDGFLKFNEYEILKTAGTVSHEVAKQLAGKEYEKYRITQDQLYESDFDQVVKKIINPVKKT
ncbi:MAG: RhuM family protein [Bacteroidales bacterium]